MSGDGGLREWLDARYGAGKWALSDYPRGDIEIALSSHTYADLCIEYGYQRLQQLFSLPQQRSGSFRELARAELETEENETNNEYVSDNGQFGVGA